MTTIALNVRESPPAQLRPFPRLYMRLQDSLPIPFHCQKSSSLSSTANTRISETRRDMKSSSKVIMGATLVMVISLAIVSCLVLVLLAELYCFLLLRRRRVRLPTSHSTSTTIATAATPVSVLSSSFHPQDSDNQATSPLSSFYAQGVLHAPRSFLFPQVSPREAKIERSKFHQILQVHAQEYSNTSPRQIGILSPSSASTSFGTSPQLIQEIPIQGCGTSSAAKEKACAGSGGGGGVEHVVYISNPIYDNEACRPSRADTPFETPDSSPSHLEEPEEESGSSSDEERAQPISAVCSPITPPLSPMKKLPAEACSISLRDAGSLGTSGSDSNSNNGISSSSSGTPCTSPSW